MLRKYFDTFVDFFSYSVHVFLKFFVFVMFGIMSFLVSVTLFPFLRIFVHPREKFMRLCRRILSLGLRVMIRISCILGVINVQVSDLKKLRSLKSAIVVANHPSMIDSVLLVSFLPCTDFIAKSSLKKSGVLGLIVSKLYIPNSMEYNALIERCKENFTAGGTLALFPEGTRSLASGQRRFKKGAARLSLATGCPIVPVHIGGNDKRGLRKHDNFIWLPKEKTYRYVFTVKDLIYPDEFKNLPMPIAAKHYTEKIRQILAD